jgi:hypothetical protein
VIVSPRRQAQFRGLLPVRAQRARQQPHRPGMRARCPALFQVADHPDAHARGRSQLPLGQAGVLAVAADQPARIAAAALGHNITTRAASRKWLPHPA